MQKIINKWKKLPTSAKSSICFIISSFILKGISFLTTPIYTRIIESSQYGIVTTYNSWLTILEVFSLIGLTSAGVFNVGMNENKDNRSEYISTCLGLCNIITILFFLVVIILKLIIGPEFIIENKYLAIMFIHYLFSPAQIFWITRQRYEFKYKLATIISISSVLVGQIISIILVFLSSENGGFMKIIGNEIGMLLFAIPIYIYLIRKGKRIIDKKKWKYILMFALPLVPHYLSQHLMSSMDRIMISEMISLSDAAIYNVVSSIGMIGTIFWSAINASLVPYTFEKINNKQTKDINNTSQSLLLGYLIVCALIILVAPEILTILAPKEYQKGIYVVPPVTVVVFLQALYNLYANIEFYFKKSKNITIATTIAAIINLILNYIFIPRYGIIAAAYTTLFSYICLAIMHYFGYKKCEIGEIYNNKFVVLLTSGLTFFSIICNLLYSYNKIRYSFIIVILLLLILNSKKIIQIIKKTREK